MANYLIKMCVKDSEGGTHVEYHVVKASDENEAQEIALAMVKMIEEIEQFDSHKHGYMYEGRYYDCYANCYGEIKP